MGKANYYIDIFAGCGGLSAGLKNAEWTGLFAIEKNPDAFLTLKHNLVDRSPSHFAWPDWLPMREHDINDIIKNYSARLLDLRGTVSLVVGGPPCQGFSMAGKRDKNDQRNRLVKSYIKFIKLVMPEMILFENVYGFTVHFKKKGTKQYSSYVERALQRLGYKTNHSIVDLAEFGVPQNRKRFILVATLNRSSQDFFSVLHEKNKSFCVLKGISNKTTAQEALSDLEQKWGVCPSPDTKRFMAGKYGPVQSGFQKLMRTSTAINGAVVDSHRFVNHRAETIDLHRRLLQQAPAGKRIAPADNTVAGLNRRGVTVLDPNSQAPTITSIPDEIVHYCEPRILTVREQARIQGFPDWFEFKGKYTSGGKRRTLEVPRYTQVGNAVPPLFAEQVGLALLEVLKIE